MFPIKHSTIYRTPEQHQPPDEANLAGNTQYPNLNSRDYAKRLLNRNLRMHSAWECITLNDEKNAIIATNKLCGREWAGSLWGFLSVDDDAALDPAQSCFKLQCQALISHLQYVSNNIFLLALRSGHMQVWSTRSEVRNPSNPYCMFLIGDKCEHLRPITCMDVMKTNADEAVSGSKDGTLKVWDMGCADLTSTHTFRFAHTDVITGVDTSHRDASVFVSCSLDRSALLWDVRLTRPAMAIYETDGARFRHLAWANPTQSANEQLIYLGDESGFVHTVDIRMCNQYLNSTQYFDRPIHRIVPMEHKIAVIGDTNVVKVADATSHTTIYENAESQHFVRDAIWRSSNKLLTVGYEGKLRAHNIQ